MSFLLTVLPWLMLSIAFGAMLLILITDLRTQMIPDLLSGILFVTALLYHLLQGVVPIAAPLLAAGFFLLQWIVSRGKWVGSGDIVLAAGLGMLLGSKQLVVFSLMLSYILGAAVASILLLRGNTARAEAIAFGPFLIVGTVVGFVWGEGVLEFLF